MDLILVRYSEVGLKSRSVRSRFERVLMDNMISALAREGIEALVNCDQGRIYVRTDKVRIDDGIKVLQRVFGIASVSPVIETSSDMESLKATAVEYSKDILADGSTFKIKSRRVGSHPFTSMDIAVQVGEAVLNANQDRGIKVDIHNPTKEVYVEVRDNQAFIFSEYCEGTGGLPMGSQGKVLVVLEKDTDALAAWLIMKRGCRAVAMADEDNEAVRIVRRWDPDLKVLPKGDLQAYCRKLKASAIVYGYLVEDEASIKESVGLPVPAFYPIIGMDAPTIAERMERIRC
ncbi:MAG TPA: THUMP domain-containing protein [Methanomassiliicoccales archaeon]|jgi:thiamine biosynthesis protein ThiI